MLLAAAVPARSGEAVLEAGSGAGAGLLCLAHRVPGLVGLGIEREAGLVAIAQANAAANGCAGLDFRAADLLTPHRSDPPARFHHAFANPPYHLSAGTSPRVPARQRAKHAAAGLLTDWCPAMAARLTRGGTLTLIIPAAALSAAAAALKAAGCGGLTLYPLWPRQGRPAKLILLQGVKDSRAPDRVASGLVLHAGDRFTPEADAVLRDGAALPLRPPSPTLASAARAPAAAVPPARRQLGGQASPECG